MLILILSVSVFIVHLKPILCLRHPRPFLVLPILIIDLKKGEKDA